jgi:hypothetical protein
VGQQTPMQREKGAAVQGRIRRRSGTRPKSSADLSSLSFVDSRKAEG